MYLFQFSLDIGRVIPFERMAPMNCIGIEAS